MLIPRAQRMLLDNMILGITQSDVDLEGGKFSIHQALTAPLIHAGPLAAPSLPGTGPKQDPSSSPAAPLTCRHLPYSTQ